jgi:hypothetical protein
VSLVNALFIGMSGVLLLSGLALVYIAVSGIQVVVYRQAVLALGGSAMLLVVAWLISDLTYHGIVDSRLPYFISDALLTVGAAVHLWAVWLFARDFVQFESESMAIDVGESGGGFENE